MKEVFIISTGEIINGKIAGSQRVLKLAKALAAGNINVYLCSLPQIISKAIESVELYPGISYLKSTDHNKYGKKRLLNSLSSVNRFINERESESVIYLYPTTFVFKDIIYLLYFKALKGHRFFCDINELRATNVFSTTAPGGFLRRIYFYLKGTYYYLIFKLSELQVYAYNGIVVISTNLEKYFSKFTKNIIRVPILCDIDSSTDRNPPACYDDIVFRICFAGLINCTKEGFDILFESLSSLNNNKNVELYLYGTLSDEDRVALDFLKDRHKIKDKVFYKGNLDPADLFDEFLKYHLLILPRPLNAQARYGFSTKLSEYLISGVPVLVTDVSDNAMYIKDGLNGFIIPPGSPAAMTNKILDIMGKYSRNSSEIAANARSTAAREFDYRIYTEILINFFYSN